MLIGGIGRLPGPPWLFYVIGTVVFALAAIGLRWLDGSWPVGEVRSIVTVIYAGAVFYPLAVIHYLNTVARRSLAEFRPALGALDPEYDRLERELTTMPRGLANLALVLALLIVALGILTAPGGWGVIPSTSIATSAFSGLAGVVLNVPFVVYVIRTIRQLAIVARIHRESTNIRLYDSGPHNAFARFTLIAAVSITVPYAILEVLASVLNQISVVEIVLFVLSIVLSIVLFVVPLNGMHRRLIHEKADRLAVSDGAFELAATRLHADVGANDYARADETNKVMSSLTIEADRIRKVSTWPWSAETLRGFATALGLPILLWLITTILGRVLGG
jgi:hypothetical protein